MTHLKQTTVVVKLSRDEVAKEASRLCCHVSGGSFARFLVSTTLAIFAARQPDLPSIPHPRLAHFADDAGDMLAPVSGAQSRRQVQQRPTRPCLNHVRCHSLLTAEVESDPDPSTPPQGSDGPRIENGGEFGKERPPLLWHRIGHADWYGDSRLVIVMFDELNFMIDAKIDGRTGSKGSQQQVQLVEQNVPLGLDGVRVHERPASFPINCHYVRRPKLPARDKGFAKHGAQVESAVFVNAWIGQD